MKYKVGDKVRVREDLEVGRKYGVCEFTEEMMQFRGKSMIVEEVYFYIYNLMGVDGFGFTEEMLEEVDEMKYKVGDKVRVRKDLVLGKRYRGLDCLQGHKKECGKIFTIENSDGHYYILNDRLGFWWSEEMLEDVNEMKETVICIEIISDGKNVKAKYGNKVGIAKCSPEDEFDIFTGARLAIDRLEEKCSPYGWLKLGMSYYRPDINTDTMYTDTTYYNDAYDKILKSRGLVFKTKEEAINCAKKMLEVVK